jgi:hypothetical protein
MAMAWKPKVRAVLGTGKVGKGGKDGKGGKEQTAKP